MFAPKPPDRDVLPDVVDAKSALLRDSEALRVSLGRFRPEDFTEDELVTLYACLRELRAFLQLAGHH